MYAGKYINKNPDRAAFIMAGSGEAVTYRENEQRTNQLAHLLRDYGLNRLGHYSTFMENNSRYLECSGAGGRSDLYCTCVNSYLKYDELAYILNNSESKILITSAEKLSIAKKALQASPGIVKCLVVGAASESDRIVNFEEAVSAYHNTPIDDEFLGTPMLYSSGTTGGGRSFTNTTMARLKRWVLPQSTAKRRPGKPCRKMAA